MVTLRRSQIVGILRDEENTMSRDFRTRDPQISLRRIPDVEHRDLILAQCYFWSFVRRQTDATGEYLALCTQFAGARSGQVMPLYEWEIEYDRATSRRILAL